MIKPSKPHANMARMFSYLCGLALTCSFFMSTAYQANGTSAITPKAVKTTKAITSKSKRKLHTVLQTHPSTLIYARHAVDPRFAHTSTKNATSINWAGYVATGGPATFLKARTTFTIPTITGKPDPNRIVSLWAGVGGTTSDIVRSLVQAGIDSALEPADRSSSKPYQVNEAWIEVYPQPPQTLPFTNPKSLSPGDPIRIEVKAGQDKQNHKIKLSFTITDNASNETQTLSLSTSDATFQTDGASGECILERPLFSITNDVVILPQFETANFGECQVSKANDAADLDKIGTYPNLFRVDMTNDTGTVIASTSSLSGNENFSVRRVGDHQ